jgi:hypothetical protein
MARLRQFAKSNLCHVFLVAHPKQRPNWRGEVRSARAPAPGSASPPEGGVSLKCASRTRDAAKGRHKCCLPLAAWLLTPCQLLQ